MWFGTDSLGGTIMNAVRRLFVFKQRPLLRDDIRIRSGSLRPVGGGTICSICSINSTEYALVQGVLFFYRLVYKCARSFTESDPKYQEDAGILMGVL